MHGIAREEHAAAAVGVREQQVLLPFADVEHLELERHRDCLRELAVHVAVLLDDGVQREMSGGILHDQLGRAVVGHVIVAALADGDALKELVAAIERLAQLQDVALTAQRDAKLLAHDARAAVAADEIARADLRRRAGAAPHVRRDGCRVLFEVEKLAAVANGYRGQSLRDRFEQRLERVLRDELIGLERQRAVVARGDFLARLLD